MIQIKTKINSESEKSNYDFDRTDIKSDCEEEPNHSSDKLIELEEVKCLLINLIVVKFWI